MQPFNLEELQGLIEKLDGVISSKLTADESGELTEVHVLADRSRAPKQLSRDIQSAVAAFTGRTIEHRIISIAQIDGGEMRGPERLRIRSFDISTDESSFSATVYLAAGETVYKGAAGSVNAPVSRYGALANACLAAVHEYLRLTPFCLSDVKKFHIANVDEMNVAICLMQGGRSNTLTGTAVVQGDEYGAVIKATLDAINRALPVVAS